MSGTTQSNEVKTKKLLSLVNILEPLSDSLGLNCPFSAEYIADVQICFQYTSGLENFVQQVVLTCPGCVYYFFLFQIMIYGVEGGLNKYIEKRETVQCKYLRFWSIFLLSNNLAGGKRGAVSSHL